MFAFDSFSIMLDSLPVEIVRRIAVVGPFESTLALRKVNHALRRACTDRLVFRGIIDTGNGSSVDMPIWQSYPLTLQSPILSWEQYALADSKARQVFSNQNVNEPAALMTNSQKFVNWAIWAPQLIASHRKLDP